MAWAGARLQTRHRSQSLSAGASEATEAYRLTPHAKCASWGAASSPDASAVPRDQVFVVTVCWGIDLWKMKKRTSLRCLLRAAWFKSLASVSLHAPSSLLEYRRHLSHAH